MGERLKRSFNIIHPFKEELQVHLDIHSYNFDRYFSFLTKFYGFRNIYSKPGCSSC